MLVAGGNLRLGREEPPTPGPYPSGRFVAGAACQWHALLPVDCFWMLGNPGPTHLSSHPYAAVQPGWQSGPMEAPLYPDRDLSAFLAHCLEPGGAVTFNVGIYQEGFLGADTVQQIRRIGVK